MKLTLRDFRGEFAPMLRLAAPVVVSELGWMSMGVVDTVMVGRVSKEAIGGVSLGSILFYTIGIFGTGLLLGLDTLVSQAFGARKIERCHRCLLQGLYLSAALSPILMGIVWLLAPALRGWDIRPEILEHALPYMRAASYSMGPLLIWTALRRYLQAMSVVTPVVFALISANLVNVAANWILIFGHFGVPAMGAEGAAWATTLSRVYMVAVLVVFLLYREWKAPSGLFHMALAVDGPILRSLCRLGLPASGQITLEVGVFAVATALIGKLDAASAAAHQIALNAASVTFMVPLGIGSAGAVRVGQALGRGDARAARLAGWTAVAFGAAFMSLAAVAFVFAPRLIVRVFTPDPSVIATAISLLLVAAFFQLFDGVQVVVTGVMRGAGETRIPMVTNLVGYWLLGLPAGYVLCFWLGWGAIGVWMGLCAGLIIIGATLLFLWTYWIKLAPIAETAAPVASLH